MNSRNVYQMTLTVSVPKKELLEWVVYNKDLSKKDLRVFMILLTELHGYSSPLRGTAEDPQNFRKIDTEKISVELEMDESDVKESIKHLRDNAIIERGDSTNSVNGYRFTF